MISAPGTAAAPASASATRKVSAPAAAAVVTPEEQEAVQRLSSELRCLVCQNQTIADSNATLAVDLRRSILEQLRAGKDEAGVKQYMVERYGEFILYDPPLSAGNLALWLGPALLLVAAAAVAIRLVRRGRAPEASGTEPQAAIPADRLQALEARYERERDR